jgi:hypothetical protein
MDKATKIAVEKYPHGTFDGEIGDSLRAACAVGYMQAEKDLALTWKDMRWIHNIAEQLALNMDTFEKPIYEEVLRRFNEQRKK